MAQNSLYKIVFKNSSNSGFVAGDIVITYWDDVKLEIVAQKNGSPLASGVTLGLAQFTPHRGSLTINYTVTNEPIEGPVYQNCQGTTLLQFVFQSEFPYSKLVSTENSASCVTNIVCDLMYIGAPVIVKPTTETSLDGEITVTAEGSNGAVRYSLQDDLFSVMTNTTGAFTGLSKGAYIVYARDQYNCLKSISVLLDPEVNYGELYRIEYDDQNGDVSRVSIYERDFTGLVTEVKGNDHPLVLSLRGENAELFTSVISGNATIGLVSETNFQFLDLFTQDDRKYRVIFTKDTGSGFEERWRGYIKPGLYQEQYYTETNYYVQAEATDQLENLKILPFQDSSGNNITGDLALIKIIAVILSYTDLDLPIRSCITQYEIDMEQEFDNDPLEQTFIDAQTYIDSDKPFSCYEVLSNILLSFGARIFQWEGYWYLVPADFFTQEITYREFDVNGDYVTSGYFNPLIDIKPPIETNRACWANVTQNLEVRPALGKVLINYKLKKVDFGILNGGFESFRTELSRANTGRDPFRLIPKIVEYDNWTLNLNGNIANLPFTYSAFGNGGGRSGAIESQGNNSIYATDAYLQSIPSDIIFSQSDWIRIKFDFFPFGNGTLPKFIKFKFSFKLENYYLQGDGSWSTDTDFQWIEVNVGESDFNNWKTLEIKTACPEVSGEVTSTYVFRLMHGGFNIPTWYFTSSSDLQDLPTIGLATGYITWVLTAGVVGQIQRWYRLEASTAATSDPDALRPDDYDGSTNKVVWKLVDAQEVDTGGGVAFVRNFDNVTVEILPQGDESPSEEVIENINNTRIKENLEFDIHNGDAPNDITNAKFTYINYYKYSDGTPMAWWFRRGLQFTNHEFNQVGNPLASWTNFQDGGTLEPFFGNEYSLTDQVCADSTGTGSGNSLEHSAIVYQPMPNSSAGWPIGSYTIDVRGKNQSTGAATNRVGVMYGSNDGATWTSLSAIFDDIWPVDATPHTRRATFTTSQEWAYLGFQAQRSGAPGSPIKFTLEFINIVASPNTVNESDSILKILAKRIIGQHNKPKFKLTGDLKTDVFFGFKNSFLEESSGKHFIPMGMSIDDVNNMYSVELNEVVRLLATGEEGVGQFNPLQFSNAFNI